MVGHNVSILAVRGGIDSLQMHQAFSFGQHYFSFAVVRLHYIQINCIAKAVGISSALSVEM